MTRSLFNRREFFRSTVVAAAGAAIPCWFSANSARAEPSEAKIKVFMHWDMEGTSGLFSRQQAWYKEKGVKPEVAEEGIKLLIADVNSAAEAALKAGVDQLIVCDTHGGGGNFRPAGHARRPPHHLSLQEPRLRGQVASLDART